ncbi:MAG: phosphatidylserine decarboxylase family protein [Salinivirgaceae bacterium]|nr:phosphatidylserine decarboxylase family protein [Salinivirgaceae bacterium]
MRIHKAGFGIIAIAFVLFGGMIGGLYCFSSSTLLLSIVTIVLSIVMLFILRFFRHPKRKIQFTENEVFCPADGKVVVIEEIDEKEFIKDKRIQVSIFMSVWNVHINWFPIIGKVLNSAHFNGRYMAAWLPKASVENERSVVIMETIKGEKIMIKQIAGALARRIITYSTGDKIVKPGDQLGFIRFGSRVDVLLPLNSKIMVELNQKVKGGITKLAELN